MARFLLWVDRETTPGGKINFSGSIEGSDIQGLGLDVFDQALVSMDVHNAADSLLVLEMLFRRLQEKKDGK